ncbi:MAG: FAD-dependent oxidoreductase [Oscillospiraceae bacterium]|nr:FAD-dependent oxidoreductase [Oscillospiraceae bacterium]
MSRLELQLENPMQTELDKMCRDIGRRLSANPVGLCPVNMTAIFLSVCRAQTCGKCIPCGIGLSKLSKLLNQVLDGEATPETVDEIESMSEMISESADCAIGTEAAALVLRSVRAFRQDYLEHVNNHRCLEGDVPTVPCQAQCPAGVDVPGYLALIRAGRYEDAVALIRKDNPMAITCAYICEHPCETKCRRNMVDAPVNIRALKRYAVDRAEHKKLPEMALSTGKTVGIVGGGPCGLTAAYFLSIMGHKVTIYEKRKQLGGMLRYGIPSYRFPRDKIDQEVAHILSAGIDVVYEADVGGKISYQDLMSRYDAVFVSVGAHTDKKVGIPGEDADGVTSAVMLLRGVGDNEIPDFTGKQVAVIGGGNVAMDCVRSAVRMGADKVSCVYRRRKEDMTAHILEIDGAIAEGVEMRLLCAPTRIETDENNHCTALWVQPQMIGPVGRDGRPSPVKATAYPEERIPADVIIVAVGQAVESEPLEKADFKLRRGAIIATAGNKVPGIPNLFAGGECVTGPKTAIRAVYGGKVAAANIDEFLGYTHMIRSDIQIPHPHGRTKVACGRVDPIEREAYDRKHDFVCIECELSEQEAMQESSRCLRCDHYGFGIGNRDELAW